MKKVLSAACLVLVFCAGFARAARFSIDPAHSEVGFKIRHIVSQVPGNFTKFSGAIDFDAAKPGQSSVEAVIEAASIDTDNEKRDGHLRSADFFETDKYPQITFKSRSAKAAGKDKLEVAGDLTMHGVTKPVTLSVDVHGVAKDPWGGTRAGFTAKTQIKRSDFGIVYNKTLETGGLMLGDEVNITIEIEARQE